MCTCACQWAHKHTHTHTHKRGNSERCHLCEERSVFQTVSGSEFAFSVECKSGWIKQHLASADGLSLCICVCTCVCACVCACVCVPVLWWCPQAPGFDAGKSVDSPLLLSGPISLFFLSLKVSFPSSLTHHVSLCFHLLSVLLTPLLPVPVSSANLLFLLVHGRA